MHKVQHGRHIKITLLLRCLLGSHPNGVPSFVSDVYGGRISDKELVTRSSLCQLFEPGDRLMADRGFLVEDLLPDEVSLNIPPFLDWRAGSSLSTMSWQRRSTLHLSASMWNGPLSGSRTAAFYHFCQLAFALFLIKSFPFAVS